jgi:hypothetical protein
MLIHRLYLVHAHIPDLYGIDNATPSLLPTFVARFTPLAALAPALQTRFRKPALDSQRRFSMLFYCQFTWFPGTSRENVAKRVVQQHDAGSNNPDRIKGWYNLAGGGAGFLIVDYDDIRELTAFLQPYMDLMSFDVRAISEIDYKERIEQLRTIAHGQAAAVSRHDSF